MGRFLLLNIFIWSCLLPFYITGKMKIKQQPIIRTSCGTQCPAWSPRCTTSKAPAFFYTLTTEICAPFTTYFQVCWVSIGLSSGVFLHFYWFIHSANSWFYWFWMAKDNEFWKPYSLLIFSLSLMAKIHTMINYAHLFWNVI